jgi:hypothetical protein
MNGIWPKAEFRGHRSSQRMRSKERKKARMRWADRPEKGQSALRPPAQPWGKRAKRAKRPRPRCWVTGPATSDDTNSIKDGIIEEQARSGFGG